MTQPSHASPHRIFWHCFSRLSETLRKPLGNPRKPSQLQRKHTEVTPSKCLHTPFAPLQGFHPASRVSFLGADASHSIGRRQHTILEHTFRARQLDPCAEDVMPPGTQDPLATLTTPYKSTPVGFEPTRGDPRSLAGRRLSRSAKVSSAKSASQLRSSPGSHVTVSLCFLCPLTSPSHPLSPTHENNVHQLGIEPGSHQWRRCILPLDQ